MLDVVKFSRPRMWILWSERSDSDIWLEGTASSEIVFVTARGSLKLGSSMEPRSMSRSMLSNSIPAASWPVVRVRSNAEPGNETSMSAS